MSFIGGETVDRVSDKSKIKTRIKKSPHIINRDKGGIQPKQYLLAFCLLLVSSLVVGRPSPVTSQG